MRTISAFLLHKASLYTERTIPYSPDGGDWATAVSNMVTQMVRHYQDERQTDGSRYWDTIRPTLVKVFARKGARDFDDDYWLVLAAMDLFVICELFRNTLVVFKLVQNR